jgi:tetratricopeptide (TPR) repeat protein
MGSSTWIVILTSAVLWVTDSAGGQDMVELQDGRIVSGPRMSRTAKGVTIHFKNGDVTIPADRVRIASVSAELGETPVLTDDDQEKVAQGLVRFDGKWMKPAIRDRTLKARQAKARKAIEEAMKHRRWKDRYRLSTKFFEFEYTIAPEKAKEYAALMDNYFQVFTREWGIHRPRGMGKLKVCFYHDQEYYQQVSGAEPGVIGYFRFAPPEELNFFYDRLDEAMTVDVMFHETNHYLTHLIDPKFNYPSWVNESLAEYYGASEWDPERKKMTTGHLQEGRLAVVQDAVANDQWQGLEELIRLERQSFNATHYAWGWSLVHFLMEDKRYESGFKRFYMALAKDRTIERQSTGFSAFSSVPPDAQIAALKRYLKIEDLDALETEWRAYIKGLQATGYRGWALGGAIYLSRGMPIKARRFLETAIKMGDRNPHTYYQLGRACLQKDDVAGATKAFEEAIELDPLNGIYLVQLARCKERESDAKNDEVRRLKRLAMEIEPDNDEVVRSLGFDDILTEIFSDPPGKAGGN